jgi:hypothetical protein
MPITGFVRGNINTGGQSDRCKAHEEEFRSFKHDVVFFMLKPRGVENRGLLFGVFLDCIAGRRTTYGASRCAHQRIAHCGADQSASSGATNAANGSAFARRGIRSATG